jgi:hypothetical protein
MSETSDNPVSQPLNRDVIPSYAIDLIGEETVDLIYETLDTPEVDEINDVITDQDISKHDQFEYLLFTPKYKLITNSIRSHSDRITEKWCSEMPEILDGLRKNDWRPIKRRIVALNDLLTSFKDQSNEQKFLNKELHALFSETVRSFLVELSEAIRNPANGMKKRHYRLLLQAMNDTQKRLKALNNNSIGLFGIWGDYENLKTVLAEKLDVFDEAFATTEYPEDLEDLEEGCETLAAEVDELSRFRQLQFTKSPIGVNQEIHFYGSEYDLSSSFWLDFSGMVRLMLDKNAEFQALVIAEDNQSYKKRPSNPNALEFYIDRFSGDLCFVGSQVSIEPVLGKERYLKLQYLILNELKKLLLETEEMPVYDDEEDSSEQTIEHELDESPEEVTEEVRESVECVAPGEQLERPAEKEEKSAAKLKHKLRGLKSKKVSRILKALLSYQPGGSHHRFHNEQGGWIAVPLGHREVNRHILYEALKCWGILESFCERL